jgi:hypothetical protein
MAVDKFRAELTKEGLREPASRGECRVRREETVVVPLAMSEPGKRPIERHAWWHAPKQNVSGNTLIQFRIATTGPWLTYLGSKSHPTGYCPRPSLLPRHNHHKSVSIS